MDFPLLSAFTQVKTQLHRSYKPEMQHDPLISLLPDALLASILALLFKNGVSDLIVTRGPRARQYASLRAACKRFKRVAGSMSELILPVARSVVLDGIEHEADDEEGGFARWGPCVPFL